VLSRSRINGTFTGLLIRPDSMTPTPNVSVRNSLVTSGPTGLAAVEFAMDMGAPAVFSAVGSTFIGRGNSQAALYAHRNTDGSPALTATLRNSIARVEGTGSDLWADRASFDIASSSFTTRKLENGGTAPDPGAGSNVSGDPMLAPDFSLVPSSPLIDRGDPSVALAGELDLAGAARSLDGNGDCVLAPDIGAFERPDLCPPNAAPALTKVRAVPSVFAPVAKRARARATARKVKRGTRFRYTLSEAARVRITIERRGVRKVGKRKRGRFRKVTVLSAAKQAGRQSTRFTGRVRGKALKPGRYRARLVAIDALGARSGERRLKLRIVRP